MMTDRGLPMVDGAPACPFVAFDDDREERASAPDPRHRCYADVRPAPRAPAHQDAYCLSSAFALCPTFQDWATRESARVHEASAADSLADDDQPRRNPQRGWAAPPPWLGGAADPTGGDVRAQPELTPELRAADTGLAGSLAHQIAMGESPAAAAQAWATPSTGPSGAVTRSGTPPAAGLPEPGGTGPAPWARPAYPPGVDVADDRGEDGSIELDRTRPIDRDRAPVRLEGTSRMAGLLPGRGRPKVGDTRPRRAGGELSAPSWERPQRYEAYPTLRTRIGLPAIPRLVFLAVGLVVAMVGLFMLPGLIGIGGPAVSPTPVASPSRSVAPSGSPGPSVVPGPTAQSYLVQPGDTMSKIAAKFGITLAELLAANKDLIPNPDKIVVGDAVVIPAPLPSGFVVPSVAVPSPTVRPSPTRTPTRTPTRAPTRAP